MAVDRTGTDRSHTEVLPAQVTSAAEDAVAEMRRMLSRAHDVSVASAAIHPAGTASTTPADSTVPPRTAIRTGMACTLPLAVSLLGVLVYAGGHPGAVCGADLGRFVGVRGLMEVPAPSRGAGVKAVDSSALRDGPIAGIARATFLDGTLIAPASSSRSYGG